ncbi:MAG: ABC transporter permease subunit [Eggerthellaceae bacterium]|nr:ABC transporter permease subunit [Eggerthellaceae bacterium]
MNKTLSSNERTAKSHETDAPSDSQAPKGARLTATGKIKIDAKDSSDTLLHVTLFVLTALTIWTFAQMNYNGVDILDATRGAFNNLSVIAFSPGTDGYWTMGELLDDLFLTLCLAIVTTLVGALLAVIIALPAACNLTNKPVSNAIKLVLSFVRAVPTIVWVLIFIVAISLGAEACIVGMMFHTTAFLAKAFSEAFEEIDQDVLDALHATGASWLQVVTHCVLPEKLNELLSWTFIRFENNFVNAVVIAAMCGSGGIGYQLFLAANFYFSMHAVGLITYLCLAVSVVLEIISSQLRKRFIVNK